VTLVIGGERALDLVDDEAWDAGQEDFWRLLSVSRVQPGPA
jgi:hypothetical protein